MLLVGLQVNAAPIKVENIVFEGAGIRGIAYSGVVSELERMDVLKNVKRVGGTSAGAITALAISLGYSADEITDLIFNTDFQDFNDGAFIFFGGFYRLATNYGWYRGDAFEDWLEQLILQKIDNPNITFAELSEHGFKDLYVTATSLNNQKLIVFSKENFPQMKIKDAVRISMSIPLYFEAIFIDSLGNVYDKQNVQNSLDLVVDGGFIANFPIFIFDSIYLVNNRPFREPNFNTIGVRIDTDEQIEHDKNDLGLAPIEISSISDYIQAFYVFTLESLNRNNLTADDWKRTISVSDKGIGPKVKRLSEVQKNTLIQSGIESTNMFFSNNL